MYQVESLAQGPEGAAKVQIIFKVQPTRTDVEDVQSNASSTYRRAYGAWPLKKPGAKVMAHEGGKWVPGQVKDAQAAA